MLPLFLKPFFWSYDFTALDRDTHKFLIIFHSLNYGTKQVTDWVFEEYNMNDIRQCLQMKKKSAWHKKSLNYWTIMLGK